MAATNRVVDLTKVTEGGNFRPRRKPEADYRAKIVKVDDHQPKDQSKPQGWVYTIMVDGDGRSTYPYYVNPSPKEAWKIGTISAAAGFKIIGKRVNFNPNKLVGKPVGIFLEDDEYDGKPKSVIGDIFPVSEVGNSAEVGDDIDTDEVYDDEDAGTDEDEAIEEEPPAPRKRTARKAQPEPEPDPEDEYEDEEPEPTPPPRKRARKAAPAPPVEDDDYEDEEVVEAPPVRRRAATKAAAPVKRTRPKAPPVVEDDDDLDDLDVDELP
jgi:hypothetical protein